MDPELTYDITNDLPGMVEAAVEDVTSPYGGAAAAAAAATSPFKREPYDGAPAAAAISPFKREPYGETAAFKTKSTKARKNRKTGKPYESGPQKKQSSTDSTSSHYFLGPKKDTLTPINNANMLEQVKLKDIMVHVDMRFLFMSNVAVRIAAARLPGSSDPIHLDVSWVQYSTYLDVASAVMVCFFLFFVLKYLFHKRILFGFLLEC